MPRVQLRPQTDELFTEGVVLRLRLLMRLACLAHARILGFDCFARGCKFLLGAVPMVPIPFAQNNFQVGLRA